MTRLALTTEQLGDDYEVVVVGSGYGGAIAASRLARAGRQVCLLERGREILPGEFPDTFSEARRDCQIDIADRRYGNSTGLYHIVLDDDIDVLKGCGLGGTSLINANVAIEADARVFDDACWPVPLRGQPTALQSGYARARQMLGSNPLPENGVRPLKTQRNEQSAAALNARYQRLDLNITFEDRVNDAGIAQPACNSCGDCVSGCNYGSKNTLAMNYLPDAKAWGSEIFTGVNVLHLERQDDHWLVHYELLDPNRPDYHSPARCVRAQVVVLGAGSLGTTEILLRSRDRGLSLSNALGTRFSGNGDALSFAYNCDEPINGIGWGEREQREIPSPNVGPCITSAIDLRQQADVDDGILIEEGCIPGALRQIANASLAVLGPTQGRDTDPGLVDDLEEWARHTLSLATFGNQGAAQHTQTYLVMSHDRSAGTLRLEGDRLRMDWAKPQAGSEQARAEAALNDRIDRAVDRATTALGGTVVANPLQSSPLKRARVTVHPLGGCAMGDSAEHGVTNHMGQVFAGDAGTNLHDGLLVCDGALIPRSLGANPLLTIAALAERNIELFCCERGWTIDSSPRQLPVAEPARPGLQFTETMRGFIDFGAQDFQPGYEAGQRANTPFEFTLTASTDDLATTLNGNEHRLQLSGSALCPSISSAPLRVSDGELELLTPDPASARAKNMRYRLTLVSDRGERFALDGFKDIEDDAGFDLWSDTTTLYVTLTRLPAARSSAASPTPPADPVAKGVLHISVGAFVDLVSSIHVRNVDDSAERLAHIARFGSFFLGELYRSFGGVVAPSSVFDATSPPRKRRPLNLPAPTFHEVKTRDDVALKLTRYHAGNKGPVILAPGMGTSTQAFALDTIDVSLAELLAAHGYDLWLLDYRASSALPASRTRFDLDDIAQFDYPAAVGFVRRHTNADSVQVVAHCVASACLFMSLLSGDTEGVRCFVASQFTPFVESTPLVDLKSNLRLPSLLDALGVDVLSTEFDSSSGLADQAYDALLRLYPAEIGQLCNNPVCRRIRFMWGEVFEHGNLNHATHEAIHELFGDGNLQLFQHLTTIIREGRLVNRRGEDVYLPRLNRLRFPITLLQGSDNTLFLPSGSRRSFDVLAAAGGADLYRYRQFDGYRHMDLFIGRDAHRDVFGYILDELNRVA